MTELEKFYRSVSILGKHIQSILSQVPDPLITISYPGDGKGTVANENPEVYPSAFAVEVTANYNDPNKLARLLNITFQTANIQMAETFVIEQRDVVFEVFVRNAANMILDMLGVKYEYIYDKTQGHKFMTTRKPVTHELKTWEEYFEEVRNGNKKFEMRYNDRDFHQGDIVILKEWIPGEEKFTGREMAFEIGYVLDFFQGLRKGWVVFDISKRLDCVPVSDDEEEEATSRC